MRWPWRKLGIVATVLLLVLLLLLSLFPFGLFKGFAERRLSASYGRPVTIESLSRLDPISFAPRLRLTGVRIPQVGWAGRGDMIRLQRIEGRLSIFPLLIGRVSLRDIRIDGLDAVLVRDKVGRESWSTGDRSGSAGPPRLAYIANSRLRYIDHKRDRSLDAAIALGASGFRLNGSGRVKGTPVTVMARGAPVASGPWPFRAELSGPSLTMQIVGQMDRAFDLAHLDARITARADNLTLVDAIIEAGLPATQPVRLSAQVRRDRPDWIVKGLAGTIGRSDIAGDATIKKRNGRHIIAARLSARRFDFEDLADAPGRAIAAAKRQRYGARLFPDTAIDLDNVARTDGKLTLHVDRLLWPGPSPFRRLDATLNLDHSRVQIPDLRLGLTHGTLAGRVEIDQRQGGPILTSDLQLTGARLADFAPGAGIDAPMQGRWRLKGAGRTVRSAIGKSSGHIAVVAREGILPAKTAILLGQDLGGLFKSKSDLARLRCLVVRLDARNGTASANPIVIDTSRAVTRATGTIDFATERLSLVASGVPKRDVTLRVSDAVPVRGTIKVPEISLPEGRGTLGTVFKAIGNAIDGDDNPVAVDQDCSALIGKALAQ